MIGDLFNNFIDHSQVYYNSTMWSAPSWVDNSVDKALHLYHRAHEFESTSNKKKYFVCCLCEKHLHNHKKLLLLEDPFCGVKVPCIGDQLTRIRFAGAKYLRAGAHTNKDRVDHLYPFQIAAWHTKRSFLKVPMIARYWIGRCPLTLGYYQIICARGQMLNPLHHLFWSKYKSHVQLSWLSPPFVHCHWQFSVLVIKSLI